MSRLYAIILALQLLQVSLAVYADAIMRSQAVEASSIVEYYIDEQGVRAELEIGPGSLNAFRNLMPDAIYRELGHGDTPVRERLETLFEQDLAILVNGRRNRW